MGRAWVREVPASFSDAIVGERGRKPDVGLARQQHRDYCNRLAESGLNLISLPADESHPDCVFVEDTAVIIGDRAVITRPGAPARRGEVEPVSEALSEHFDITTMSAPATLDGGDVMLVGSTVYVGRSARTNQAGFEHLAEVARGAGFGCVAVSVSGVLHLKSAVLPVSHDTVVVTLETVDESRLAGLRIVYENPSERHLFSALPLADRLLVTSAAPQTGRVLQRAGFEMDMIDVSEILAADGGLTCMSIIDR